MDLTSDVTTRPSLDKDADTVGGGTATDLGAGAPPLSSVPPIRPAADPVGATKRRFRLVRSRTDRMLGGVCGGLAESLGVDAALLRIGLVALTVLGMGSGVVLYAAAWILAPEADAA